MPKGHNDKIGNHQDWESPCGCAFLIQLDFALLNAKFWAWPWLAFCNRERDRSVSLKIQNCN